LPDRKIRLIRREIIMRIDGLHFLLTYQCTYECDHCFVWGSPNQSCTFTLEGIREALRQANEAGSVEWAYFEGGEPFLYYPILVEAVRETARLGFQAGIVTNSYWATTFEDACQWLAPLAGLVQDLSVSSDLYHSSDPHDQRVENARRAALAFGIPCGTISIAQPEAGECSGAPGKLPEGESGPMYRGRAAERLAPRAVKHPWDSFRECPYEDLREPRRLHLDPLGNLHICQGIAIGNLFQRLLADICEDYDPDTHPICDPLLAGGPVELVRRYGLAHEEVYADACHLCYSARLELRQRFPEVLAPNQMYGA
jgi:MoaA/NifB/PqqE/SkfB family radical SAM enzyme